ncbi:MAG: L-histidine N(alpha)-methyltransferase [Longimicrobiales bacterium]
MHNVAPGAALPREGEQAQLLHDVIEGFSRPQKELPPKYFYDQRGSELFEAITRLDEYYPTRTESALLESFAAPWMQNFGARALIELGAGNAEKTRVLLDALGDGAMYIPVDISEQFLKEAAREIEDEYPELEVQPAVSDITKALRLPPDLPSPAVYAFLGSTIGNFEPADAVRLLRNVRCIMRDEDRFLIGVDLKKDIATLEAAYNDARGVTAEFNRNVLHVLNRELGTDFDAAAFDHRAFYNEAAGRIEMHLVARTRQAVHVPGWMDVTFEAGESIRTEISAKYDEATMRDLFHDAGMMVEEWQADERQWYAMVVGRAVFRVKPEP